MQRAILSPDLYTISKYVNIEENNQNCTACNQLNVECVICMH